MLERLLRIAPQAEIDVIESSAAMIEIARRRAIDSTRVSFRLEDARTARLSDSHYDAVVTLFFLDCFDETELRPLIQKIERAMVPGAMWIVSEFTLPAQGWRRWHAIAWIWTMYRFFGVVSGLRVRALPPIERLLTGANLLFDERQEERWGLIRSVVFRKPIGTGF